MSSNILITGATGYIGGTILTHLLKATLPSKIFTTVRTHAQEVTISKLGVAVLRTNLQDEEDVSRAILDNDIGIVINTTSSMDRSISLPMISALGVRQARTGKTSFFIHTSGATAFADRTGFDRGPIKDTEDVFDLVKKAEEKTSYFVRVTDIAVTKHALKHNVTSYIIVPPLVYGRGSGLGNTVSVGIPSIIRLLILDKKANKFPVSKTWQAVHVDDLALLYISLVQLLIAQNKPPPSGKDGFIFASAHELPWWEVTDHLSQSAFQRGLTTTQEVGIWDSEDQPAEKLGVPSFIVANAWNSSSNTIFDKGHQVVWKPEWTKQRLMESLDNEIQAVVDAGEGDQSLAEMVKKNKESLESK